jgi:glucose-1-phosphate adenylyltransferase
MQESLAIVMSGGRGQRLFPLTRMRSKPAVPLAGKYRIIDIPISNCLNSGINKIFVLTQFNSASLNKHVGSTYKFDMFSGGFVDILAAEQTPDSPDWFQGTADAVRQSIKHFAPLNVTYVIVLSGDQLYQMDLNLMLNYHKESNAEITVGAIPVSAQDATGLGIMKAEAGGRITTFREKPSPAELPGLKFDLPGCASTANPPREYLASMGIYIFRKESLINLLTRSTAVDFGKEVIPSVIGTTRVNAYVFDGYWTDIGTIRSFYDANLGLTSTLPAFNFYDMLNPIYTHPRLLPGSKLSNCSVHQSIIAEGCILSGADVTHSIIGVRSRVGSGTTVKHSIIMGADFYETAQNLQVNVEQKIPNVGIGNHCTIINAIVDKNARIGDNVSIINAHNLQEKDDENYYIRDGIIVIPKGATIHNGMVI